MTRYTSHWVCDDSVVLYVRTPTTECLSVRRLSDKLLSCLDFDANELYTY